MWIRIISAGVVSLLLIGASVYFMPGKQSPFESICAPHHRKYNDRLCDKVGKRAYPLQSVSVLTSGDYGVIRGLAWRNKGNIISRPGEVKRYSEKNDYYYIICTTESADSCMLHLHTDVHVK